MLGEGRARRACRLEVGDLPSSFSEEKMRVERRKEGGGGSESSKWGRVLRRDLPDPTVLLFSSFPPTTTRPMSTPTFSSSQPLLYRRPSFSTSSSSQQQKPSPPTRATPPFFPDPFGLISPQDEQQDRDTDRTKGGQEEQLTPPRSGDEHERDNGEYRDGDQVERDEEGAWREGGGSGMSTLASHEGFQDQSRGTEELLSLLS